ncbi:patatin-like phospholipase family protein [Haloimpatiens sp. FM7330]|uniref:patatin-like phospholipase family protein n=1 Tax=Haloimpatiens sp. FM7330 TaxID=3298610 RepID=UPI00363C5C01
MFKHKSEHKRKKENFIRADAVFEGGGIRGIGIIGALRCFEKNNYKWQRAAGASVGAVIAALIIAGYNSKELEKILVELDFIKFLDKDKMQRIPVVGTALGLFKEKGMYSGEYFESWIRELLKNKGISKFKDVYENGEYKLKVVASDITMKKKLIFPDDLTYYSIDPMEFEIAKAIRMSISIPFYFKPVEFQHEEGISYVVDGGVTCNYPLNIFDVEGIPRWPTIGFKFDNKGYNESCTSKGEIDPMSFLFDIADTMTQYSTVNEISNEDKERTVFIPVVDVNSTEFNISREKSLKLFKSGYLAASNFINKWDFDKYVREYRKKKGIKYFFKKR